MGEDFERGEEGQWGEGCGAEGRWGGVFVDAVFRGGGFDVHFADFSF